MRRLFAIMLIFALALTANTAVLAASITVDTIVFDDKITPSAPYNIYKVLDSVEEDGKTLYSVTGSSPFLAALNAGPMFEVNEIGTSDVYDVLYDESKGDAATVAELLNGVENKGNAVSTAQPDSDTGKVTFADLEAGYYLITDADGAAVVVSVKASENVEVSPKKEYPSIEKTADKQSAFFGEEITYTVTVTIPAGATEEIVIHDSMMGLSYVGISQNSFAAVENTNPSDGHSVDFTVSAEQVEENAGRQVAIIYTAKLTEPTGEKAIGRNRAYLTSAKYTSLEHSTEVYSYQVDVFKYTGLNKNGLAGAGFVIKNEEGLYYELDNGEVSWVEEEEQATERMTAAESYTVSFAGLANGTYTLVEKTVPGGYNKAADTEFTVGDGNVRIEVENRRKVELPFSGGVGTTAFYAVGGGLILLAAVLLIVRMRKSGAED